MKVTHLKHINKRFGGERFHPKPKSKKDFQFKQALLSGDFKKVDKIIKTIS